MNTIIYKYLPFDTGLEALQKNTIKFSTPTEFNDPFDCYEHQIVFEPTEDDISDMLKTEHLTRGSDELFLSIPELRQRFKDVRVPELYKTFKEAKENIWIACFSRSNNNILLWSHYAEKHKGYCIGYDKNELQKYFGPPIRSVTYPPCPDEFEKREYFRDKTNALFNMVLTKAIDWEYEEEERLLIPRKNLIESPNLSSIDGILTIPKELIKEVYIGVKNPLSENELRVKLNSFGLESVSVKKMRLSHNSFRLI